MFTSLFGCLRPALLLCIALLGLLVAPVAKADATDTCFNFLDAQDYVRAESEALKLTKRKNLRREERRAAYLCLGRALKQQGRSQDALVAFQRVETSSQTTEELAAAYNELGITYTVLGDLDHAELYDQRAIKAYKELGDQSDVASALNNLAMVVRHRGDFDRALALFQESLSLEPDETKKDVKLNNIAGIYVSRKDYPHAVEATRQALEIGRRKGDSHSVAIYQINLGQVLRLQGELKEAEMQLTAGYNAIRLIGDKNWEAAACWAFAMQKADEKNIPSAREWAMKSEALYREIGNAAAADAIAKQLAGK